MLILRRFLIAILFCFGISTVSFAADDAWDTKSVGQKIAELGNDDPKIRRAANDSLSSLEGIVFEPIELTLKHDSISELEQIRAAVKPHLKAIKNLLGSPHKESREAAIMLLAVIGPDAGETTPDLLKILRTNETADGQTDVTVEGLKQMAFIALLHVTPVDKPIGPTLLEIYTAAGGGQELEDASKAEAEIRGFGFAAVYIARLLVVSGRTLTEVPTLVELTSNKFRKGIRLLALETLSQLGIEAKPALPALRELLMDKDADIRESAGYILFHFQFQGNLDELPDFVKSLQLNETRSKEFSATIKELVRQNDELTKVFKDGGESVAEFIPLISRGLKSSNPVYQRTAILSLGTFGPAAKAVVPDLIEFTKSKVEATREAALLAIRQIDPTRLPANSGNESKR